MKPKGYHRKDEVEHVKAAGEGKPRLYVVRPVKVGDEPWELVETPAGTVRALEGQFVAEANGGAQVHVVTAEALKRDYVAAAVR